MNRNKGFTLIELAVVMTIVALLLGGVISKGASLIGAAKIRSQSSQLSSIQLAILAFREKWGFYPGDMPNASLMLPNCGSCANGNGNGLITTIANGATIDEPNAVMEHLAAANFIKGNFTYSVGAATPASHMVNAYGGLMEVAHDNVFQGGGSNRLNIKLGNSIPSDALHSIDVKLDNGVASTGDLRFSTWFGNGAAAVPANCFNAAAPNNWITASVDNNCSAALIID